MADFDRTGINWNREETILAFDLYCRTPFGKIGKDNPDIIELAGMLGRTPSSVALKMQNLAHYDPELQKRNVVAMAHGSRLDGEIFSEFSNDWANLSYQAQVIRADIQGKDVADIVDGWEPVGLPIGEYRDSTVKSRVGQNFFRTAVLSSYGNRCCVTGLARQELLIASHIKPWAVSDEKTERTNPCNGLCLNPIHDKAFDCGLITIDKDYRIIISRKIRDTRMDAETREWFMGYENHQISLPEKFLPGKEFIEYHNDVVFQG